MNKIVQQKSSGLSPAAKASLFYTLCSVVQKAIALIVVPLFTRIMDADAYGTYTVFQATFTLFSVFTSLCLAEYVFNNGMLKFKQDRAGFSASMLGLSSVVTLLWAVVFVAFPHVWTSLLGLSAPLLFLLLARCLISPVYDYWSAQLRYEFRYKATVALTLALTILTPLVSIPVILFAHDKASAALVCQVVVMAGVYLVPLVSIVRKSRKFFCWHYWSYALRFNLPLIPSFFATLALFQMDRLVIANISGEASAAMYAVAYSAGSVMIFVQSALSQAFTPWIYQHLDAGATQRINSIAKALVFIVGVGCFGLVLFGPEVMHLLAPARYFSMVAAIPPIAASTVLIMAFNIFITMEYYHEESKPVALVSVVAMLVNLGLNVVLIPIFGPVSAGYTTLVCYAILAGGHIILMRRALKKHVSTAPFSIAQISALSIVFVVLIVLSSALYPYALVRFGLCAFIGVVLLINIRKIIRYLKVFLRSQSEGKGLT